MNKKEVLLKLWTGSLLFAVSFYMNMGVLFRLLILILICYLTAIAISGPGKGFKRQLTGVGIFVACVGLLNVLLFILVKALVLYFL